MMNNTFDTLLGESSDFCATMRAAHIVAQTNVTVLILGESGTGKELLARALHNQSQRANQAFVTINCAALPETLAESELFGHRKGAFTSAMTHQSGRIKAADGGTLFLDEIGELPLTIQAKLLRFLESGELQALGQTTIEKVNTRIIAATNRDLHTAMKAGQFRKDLYYRLNVVPLELPPLRRRGSDILLLLKAFNTQLSINYQLDAPQYSKATLRKLRQYAWTGNVRELHNFCERMLILFSGKVIEPENLPAEFQTEKYWYDNQLAYFTLPEEGVNLPVLETQMINQALEKTAGNRSKAARLLGLSRDTLLYRLKKQMTINKS